MRVSRVACLAALLVVLAAPPASAAWHDLCGDLARSVERAQGIPGGLLQAVALAESGRWTGQESRAWPWTVTSSADTFYLASKAAAIEKVRELQAAGRTNIDVGCMQVNLHYHGQHFASVAEALDPAANVQYSADFLRSLRAETRSWGRATAHYHSRTPARGEAYRAKVFRLWNQVRRRGVEDRRLAPQQVALDAVARDAAPLVARRADHEGTAPGPRLRRPGGGLQVRASPPGAIRIMRGN